MAEQEQSIKQTTTEDSRLSRLKKLKIKTLAETALWVAIIPLYVLTHNWIAVILLLVILTNIWNQYLSDKLYILADELIAELIATLEYITDVREKSKKGKK